MSTRKAFRTPSRSCVGKEFVEPLKLSRRKPALVVDDDPRFVQDHPEMLLNCIAAPRAQTPPKE